MTTACATSRQHSCTFQNSSKAKLKGILEKQITCAQALPRFSMRAGKHTLILNYPANIVRPSPHPSLLSFVFQQGKASLWPSPSSQTHRKSPPTTEPSKSQWMDPENLEVSGPPSGLAPPCPCPSWYTQAPGTMSSKPCFQSASPRCGWNLSQREMSGPCREGEFYFWRSRLSKAVSGLQALFSKHLFRGRRKSDWLKYMLESSGDSTGLRTKYVVQFHGRLARHRGGPKKARELEWTTRGWLPSMLAFYSFGGWRWNLPKWPFSFCATDQNLTTGLFKIENGRQEKCLGENQQI